MIHHTPAPWKHINYTIWHGELRVAKIPTLHITGKRLKTDHEEELANAILIESAPELESALCNLLEWAKGNRGSKAGNPYMIPEVANALKLLAKIQGIENYLDAKTSE